MLVILSHNADDGWRNIHFLMAIAMIIHSESKVLATFYMIKYNSI